MKQAEMVDRIKEIEKVEEVEKWCVEKSSWCNWRRWGGDTVSISLLKDINIITLSLSVTNILGSFLFFCENICFIIFSIH